MSPSRFLLSTSLAALAGATGCSDDSCGPGNAPTTGLAASGGGATLTFGSLTGSPHNDCPARDAPSRVTSLSIEGTQTDGQGRITLCVGRPDLLGKQSLALGIDAAAQVRVIDLAGSAASCSFAVDRGQTATGTASATGLCGNGSDAAGFALS